MSVGGGEGTWSEDGSLHASDLVPSPGRQDKSKTPSPGRQDKSNTSSPARQDKSTPRKVS